MTEAVYPLTKEIVTAFPLKRARAGQIAKEFPEPLSVGFEALPAGVTTLWDAFGESVRGGFETVTVARNVAAAFRTTDTWGR